MGKAPGQARWRIDSPSGGHHRRARHRSRADEGFTGAGDADILAAARRLNPLRQAGLGFMKLTCNMRFQGA